jgi:hypothetical protein
MLSIGKLLTEEQGRLTVRRVLSVDGGTAKVETTYETAGSFHDVHYTDLGSLWSLIRPDGPLYGEWKGGLRTDGNDTAPSTLESLAAHISRKPSTHVPIEARSPSRMPAERSPNSIACSPYSKWKSTIPVRSATAPGSWSDRRP